MQPREQVGEEEGEELQEWREQREWREQQERGGVEVDH